MTYFSSLELVPSDPILSLPIIFNADKREKKVNLGVGVYCDEEGKTKPLNCIKEAEKLLLAMDLGKNYLPIEGEKKYLSNTIQLILSKEYPSHIVAMQTVGGTGALRLGAELLCQRLKIAKIYLPSPTWPNHQQIFSFSGLAIEKYPYADPKTGLLFEECLNAVKTMPAGVAMLLHACCHNPSGFDFSKKQWDELLALLKEKSIFPFFDLAYQGFGVDLEDDAYAVREAARLGECLVAYSFSKNLGLYGERAGALITIAQNPSEADIVQSHLKQLSRALISNPPLHPARLVATVLSDEVLTKLWHEELKAMRGRIEKQRTAFVTAIKHKCRIDPEILFNQKGMFTYCGIMPKKVDFLREKWGIYLPSDGRLNIAGLNHHNFDYVISALLDVLPAQ